MSSIKIDGKDYSVDALSQEAKTQVLNIRVAEREIKQLQAKLAIAQTARNAYAQALKAALPLESDTIKFN